MSRFFTGGHSLGKSIRHCALGSRSFRCYENCFSVGTDEDLCAFKVIGSIQVSFLNILAVNLTGYIFILVYLVELCNVSPGKGFGGKLFLLLGLAAVDSGECVIEEGADIVARDIHKRLRSKLSLEDSLDNLVDGFKGLFVHRTKYADECADDCIHRIVVEGELVKQIVYNTVDCCA